VNVCLKLTLDTGRPLYVWADDIVAYEGMSTGTDLHLTTGKVIWVLEDVDHIMLMLQEAAGGQRIEVEYEEVEEEDDSPEASFDN
jgi:hypothetical protein